MCIRDSYYPDALLYHEHFALNAKGKAPKDFKDYLEGVAWKRKIHAEKGTALFETTSHGLMTGEAISALEQALVERGVSPTFDPTRASMGQPPVDEADLARSFRVFQQHVKNNGLTHAQLQLSLLHICATARFAQSKSAAISRSVYGPLSGQPLATAAPFSFPGIRQPWSRSTTSLETPSNP